MKRQLLSQKCISFLLVSILTSICTFSLSAKVMDDKIDMDGHWEEKRKSITIELPVTASIDGSLLTIQCSTGRSDITVRIQGGDGFLYEKMYPASEAYLISIDLSYAPKGSYTLDLTNQWGDHLSGIFEIK